MKQDDLLLEATRALREELAGEAPPSTSGAGPASLTRGRIMRSLHDGRRKRATRLTVLIPLAAIFIGGSAWATAGGYTRIAAEMTALFGGSSNIEPAPAAPSPPLGPLSRAEATPPAEDATSRVEEAAPLTDDERATPLEPEMATPPDDEEAAPSSDPVANPSSVAMAAPTHAATPPAPSAPAADPGRALYEKAHHAHFVDKNPSAALTAWEAYLTQAPGGPFTTEATYNRALSLVRLGRTEQARAALTPFAEGSYGAYRQSEAQQLPTVAMMSPEWLT
jgi:hypothetical protein